MTHVFVAPHPDDIALSCGGLVASLRELGQNVTILTVFSGTGSGNGAGLTDYQRAALGFGTKANWPLTEAFRRDNIAPDFEIRPTPEGSPPWMADPDRMELTQQRANTQARQFWQRAAWTRSANITNVETEARPIADSIGGQGSTLPVDFAAADAMTIRKLEEERYAFFAEASVIFLDLPDAVHRGYEGDDQLLGEVREDDVAPYELLRSEIVRLEPQLVYFPLGVGGHVDHQLCREVGVALLSERRRWVMPGPSFVGRLSFYEDFPYAWWSGFSSPADLPAEALAGVPPDVQLTPTFADVSDQLEQKIRGISLYESQLDRLFGGRRGMADAVRRYGRAVGLAGRLDGAAERYWVTRR